MITGQKTARAGETVIFEVDAKNAAGGVVTALPTWTATQGQISYGIWRAPTKTGTYTITATADGVSTTFVITVLPSTPVSISVEVDSKEVTAGTPLMLRLAAKDYYGNAIPDLQGTWSLRGVGEVRNELFFSTKVGTADITVRANGLTAYASLRVVPGPVHTVTVTPQTASVKAGEIVAFQAAATDEYGNRVENPQVEWNAKGGVISASGVFRAGTESATGEVRATVSSGLGKVTGSATVQVTGIQGVTSGKATEAPNGGGAQDTATVGAKLKSLLGTGGVRAAGTRANPKAVLDELIQDVQAGRPDVTEQEALATVEGSLAGNTSTLSVEALDVLAEVQVHLGKRSLAINTLRARLLANPHSRSAYLALVALEAEAGEKQDLDTFVAGRKVAFDVRPVQRDGRTLVPVRALVESLGATVTWDEAAQTVTIRKGTTTVQLTLGSDRALVNGKVVLMEVPAQAENGRTLIPVRFVAEGLGLHVNWLAQERVIVITEAPLE